jgi:probable rRNA maturation factor
MNATTPRADAAAPQLRLSLQLGPRCPELPVPRARLRRWVLAALERDARLTIRFVGSDEGRALNRDFRGRDYATNVLTFAYGSDRGPDSPIEADVVICLPVVRREAAEQRKARDAHLAHLVIHGVLHAQGWEHDDDVEARRMEALETALLRRFRVADPYVAA